MLVLLQLVGVAAVWLKVTVLPALGGAEVGSGDGHRVLTPPEAGDRLVMPGGGPSTASEVDAVRVSPPARAVMTGV